MERRLEEGHVKGYLAEKPKQEQPPDVLFHIMGVEEAFHEQKAEDGKGQPPDEPQHQIQLHDLRRRPVCDPIGRLDAGGPDVVDEHGDAGSELERRSAQARPGLCLKCFHSISLISIVCTVSFFVLLFYTISLLQILHPI